MNIKLAKYVLLFLGATYLLSCIAEACTIKNGAEAVFMSVEKLVPHIAMFVLGTLFSRK